MSGIEKLVAIMQTKAELAKVQVGEFRSLVRNAALEEAANHIQDMSPAMASSIRGLIS